MDPKLFFVFVFLTLMTPGYQVLSYKTKKQFGRSYSKDYAFEFFPYEVIFIVTLYSWINHFLSTRKVHNEPVLLEASPRIMVVASSY